MIFLNVKTPTDKLLEKNRKEKWSRREERELWKSAGGGVPGPRSDTLR